VSIPAKTRRDAIKICAIVASSPAFGLVGYAIAAAQAEEDRP